MWDFMFTILFISLSILLCTLWFYNFLLTMAEMYPKPEEKKKQEEPDIVIFDPKKFTGF